jgi:putative ABC transport system substrate-binding protein
MVGIRRREVITLLGTTTMMAAWPLAARGQQPRRVAVLMNGARTDTGRQELLSAFEQQLRKLGWTEGQNLRTEYRWNNGDAALARTYAAELIAFGPDVILSSSTTNLITLQRLSPTAPIVFVQVSDPVAQGFVLNIARPGGNITGFALFEFTIGGKWVDLLKQLVPTLKRVAVMFNPETSPQSQFFMESIETAGPKLGVGVTAMPVRDALEIDPAIARLSEGGTDSLIVPTGSFIAGNRNRIIEAAARHRVPAIYWDASFVQDGGLISYGAEFREQFRQAAVYVDRILKGEKPADLPVQNPTKYELAVNLRTAKALALTVPANLLALADEVIE